MWTWEILYVDSCGNQHSYVSNKEFFTALEAYKHLEAYNGKISWELVDVDCKEILDIQVVFRRSE